MPIKQRDYDIIIWGATGFTGQLAVDKLYKRISSTNKLSIKWAIAGRNQTKLQNIKDQITSSTNTSPSDDVYPHIIIADISNYPTIESMCRSTHVLLSLAGPFIKLGEPIVRACVDHGTHYGDITGETVWVHRMIEKYSDRAQQTGSRLIPMSGFDSIPSDIGCLYACTELKKQLKGRSDVEVVEDHAYVSGTNKVKKLAVPMSIGTLSSMISLMDEGLGTVKQSSDPYLLTDDLPLVKAELQKRGASHDADQMLPKYSGDIHRYTAPFFMAIVNTRVVRRSYALYKQYSSNKGSSASPYGSSFSYNESIAAPHFIVAWIISIFSLIGAAFLLLSPVRRLLERILQWTGFQGPSAEFRANQVMTLTHVARASDGSKLHASFSVVDGGYGNTGTMLIETGILLLEDAQRRKHSNSNGTTSNDEPIGFPELSGFLTPASAFGYRLINRLKQCDGFTFQVKKFVPAK